MGQMLDSVEVTFYSESLDRKLTVDCIYRWYHGRAAVMSVFPDKSSPYEAPERDFHNVIEIATDIDILDELSDEDKDTINEKIDEYFE